MLKKKQKSCTKNALRENPMLAFHPLVKKEEFKNLVLYKTRNGTQLFHLKIQSESHSKKKNVFLNNKAMLYLEQG